jgi:hypothetical protein
MDFAELLEGLKRFFMEPMAVVMAFVALVCAIAAASRGSVRDRLLMVVLAFLSGMSAWMIVTRWRW